MKLFEVMREDSMQVYAAQSALQKEKKGSWCRDYFRYQGFQKDLAANPPTFRANGIYTLFTMPEPVILKGELFAGNPFCTFVEKDPDILKHASAQVAFYGSRNFITNKDHYAPNYRHTLASGIPGLIAEIDASLKNHKDEADKVEMLQAMRHTLCGFRQMILNYAQKAQECKQDPKYNSAHLDFMIANCTAIADNKPETFAQALQLIWFCHSAFQHLEGRGAMALGRMDQYLYPFYRSDLEAGRLTREQAVELLENVFM